MKKNAGTLDRSARVIVGLILITLAATGLFAPWGYAGIILVIVGAVGFCPFYPLLGINTCPMQSKAEPKK